MKSRKKMILKIVIGFVIALAAVSVLYVLSNLGYMIWYIKKAEQREVRLLSETDHQALLEACRELLRRVTTGDLKPQQYNVRLRPHPAASRFPQPILDLEPTYDLINPDGCVMIELHGGFLHYGAMAYPEDYKKPPLVGFKLGDRKLIDGLWYYDDDYKEEDLKYQKRIDALIQKGKKRRPGKQGQENRGKIERITEWTILQPIPMECDQPKRAAVNDNRTVTLT